MTDISKIHVGVDVSKEELVVSYLETEAVKRVKISNTIEALDSWLKGFTEPKWHFVLEATGPYSERLLYCLHKKGITFSRVNPVQSRAMSKVLSKTNKNDDQDAQTLRLMGEKLDLQPFTYPSEKEKKNKELFSVLCSLQKQECQLRNQLHSFEYRVNPNEIAVNALKNVLNEVEKEIAKVEAELSPACDEEEQQQVFNAICSIKGVGVKTAKGIIALFGDLSMFHSAKAFARFIGLSPGEYTSGSSVRGRNGITKKGNSKIRAMIFNCARSAIRYNEVCRDFYNKLIEKGKNGKVALTAVMHKIARWIYGIARSKIPFDPNFASKKQKVEILLPT
jgi:transposase